MYPWGPLGDPEEARRGEVDVGPVRPGVEHTVQHMPIHPRWDEGAMRSPLDVHSDAVGLRDPGWQPPFGWEPPKGPPLPLPSIHAHAASRTIKDQIVVRQDPAPQQAGHGRHSRDRVDRKLVD